MQHYDSNALGNTPFRRDPIHSPRSRSCIRREIWQELKWPGCAPCVSMWASSGFDPSPTVRQINATPLSTIDASVLAARCIVTPTLPERAAKPKFLSVRTHPPRVSGMLTRIRSTTATGSERQSKWKCFIASSRTGMCQPVLAPHPPRFRPSRCAGRISVPILAGCPPSHR
jgi:hypothetical protein